MTATLSLWADGRFPYDLLGEPWYPFLLMAATLLFIACAMAFSSTAAPEAGARALRQPRPWLYLSVSQLGFLALFVLEATRFAPFGYRIEPVYFGTLVVLSLIGITAWRKNAHPLPIALTLYALGQIFSILSFPLHPERSDMLPLIDSALERFLHGGTEYGNPYGLHDVGHVLPLTYLPGLWLSYLPAACFGVDLRWLNLAYMLAGIAILARVDAQNGESGLLLLALLLVTPYLQYRHEIYLAPILFWSACFIRQLGRGRLLSATVVLGLICTLSQLFWPALPAYGAYVWRRKNAVSAAAAMGFCAAVIICALGFFVLPEALRHLRPAQAAVNAESLIAAIEATQLYRGVFLHWQSARSLDAINLAVWILKISDTKVLLAIQIALVAGVAFHAGRRVRATADSCLVYMAFSIFGFVLFNRLTWTYFHLLFLFLMAGVGMLRLASATGGNRE